MSGIRVVTDSSASIPESIVSELQIEVVPLVVTVNGETFLDGFELTSERFFERMMAGEPVNTSAPTVGQFVTAYEKVVREGADQVLCVTVPRTVSGVYNAASVAAQIMGERSAASAPVVVIDTPVALGAQGFIVMELARRALEGAGMEELLQLEEQLSPEGRLYLAVDTVDYLVNGGRLNPFLGWLVTALNVKPIVEIQKRQPLPVVRARSMRAAMDMLVDYTMNYVEGADSPDIMVLHAAAPERANYVAEHLKQRLTPGQFLIQGLSPVVGAHVGPGAVAVGMLRRQ